MLHLLAILVSFVLSAIVSPAAAGTTGPPALVGVPDGSLPMELPADWGRLWIDWAGGSSSGGPTWNARTDTVDAQNQIDFIKDVQYGGPATGTDRATRYDPAGNLTFDGTYAYQYDAWNRLVQVNAAVVTNGAVVLDRLLKHHTYDGLGRLVRTRSPLPSAALEVEPLGADPADLPRSVRAEVFYYDGIRRIQEVTTDTWPNPVNPAALLTQTHLAREYVWGPGDGPGGVDELLAQFEGAPAGTGLTDTVTIAAYQCKPWWVLQDGGGDVVAVCEVPMSGSPPVVPGPARVAGQWTYDAYGSVLTAETLFAHPPLHVGHKGLFLDRLDVGVTSSSTGETERLVAAGAGGAGASAVKVIYHVRNRVYEPALGRWMQSDPNATGMVLVEAVAYHGRGLGAGVAALSMQGRYGDGASLYGYLGSSPWDRSDAMGLDWEDWWRDTKEGLGVLVNGYQTVSLLTDIHGLIQESVRSLVNDYSMNMELDADWASDWSRSDDEHTRGDDRWVTAALLRGAMEHFNLSYWDKFADRAPDDGSGFASAGSMASSKLPKGAGKVSRFIKKAPLNMSDFRKAQQEVLRKLGKPGGLPRTSDAGFDGGPKWGDDSVGYRLNKPDRTGREYWHVDFYDDRLGKKRGRGLIEGDINLSNGKVTYK